MRVATNLEQRVDERRDGARLREHDQQAEEHEHDDDRHEPVLLLLLEELKELSENATLTHCLPPVSTSGRSACDCDSARGTATIRATCRGAARADPGPSASRAD